MLAQEKLIARQDKKEVTLKEWNAIWLMYGATQRQGTSDYHLQELRKVVKAKGVEVQKDFVKKYRELKIESHRGKQASCAETLYMGTPSKSRQRFQEQRTRTDSKGRDFYQDRKSRNDSRGRSYYWRYYRPQKDRRRDFSRDMRSLSRNRSKSRDSRERNRTERGRTRERNSSEDNSKPNTDCKGCKCEDCEQLRKVAKELSINWCEDITVNE